MRLIGLAGPAGAGKDTVAEILRDHYGWAVVSFSDELYREVSAAFGVPVEQLKRRDTKEAPSALLAPRRCADPDARAMLKRLAGNAGRACSPRWVLQRWGTQCRRHYDPEYWVKCTERRMAELAAEGYPGVANTSVRFANELDHMDRYGGQVVHVVRPGYRPQSAYVSERPLPMRECDIVVSNDSDLEGLRHVVTSYLLR